MLGVVRNIYTHQIQKNWYDLEKVAVFQKLFYERKSIIEPWHEIVDIWLFVANIAQISYTP